MAAPHTRTPPHRIAILGAARGRFGALPSAMVSIDEHRRVLDWLLASFAVLHSPQIHFVAGYKADEVEAEYPDISFSFNPDWDTTGPARSLALIPLASQTSTFVSYSDVLFRPQTVHAMQEREGDLVLAIDSRWRVRYDGRSRAELDSAEKLLLDGGDLIDIGKSVPTDRASAEFAGLLKLSPTMALRLQDSLRSGVFRGSAGLPEIVRHLVQEGAEVSVLDVEGDWAELNAPQDLARFILGTKAESLERLKPQIRKGEIGELVSFTHEQWKTDRASLVRRIQAVFSRGTLIVRSSALSEDSWLQSSAGAYESVLDVPRDDAARIAAAVDQVIDSYGEEDPENQVLVQEMLSDVSMSGVVMTRTPTLGAPYYVVNFDSTSARTDTVTSGAGSALRTLFRHRGSPLLPGLPNELHDLLEIVEEIERLVGHDSLDIEFAFKDGRGHVLQVRPIAVSHSDQPRDDAALEVGIEEARRFFRECQRPSPLLVGNSTLFSVMADWNPAEMIGTKPNRLAFSLYRHLITDEMWALQRVEYGYRDVRPCNLIVDFAGHPYVDLRVDFNSFVPASLPDELAERLVDHYLDCVRNAPELHDKVEFDVLFSCLTFDFDETVERLREAGLGDAEIALLRESLLKITRDGIARLEEDLEQIETLKRRYVSISATDLEPLERAFMLLEDVRRLGIPAFSHLARNAFVGVTLMRSLVASGCVSEKDIETFMASLRTIPSAMQEDAGRVVGEEMSWEGFVEAYGHLRPGSYDITSPCYASAPEGFLRPMLDTAAQTSQVTREDPWSGETRSAIGRELANSGLGIDVDRFERFLRGAIEGREFAKFFFMRNLGDALEALADFGATHGVSREELARIRIGDLFAMRVARTEPAANTLRRLARAGAEATHITQAVCLPGLLFDETDFGCFEQLKAEPNFVTRKKVQASVVCLSSKQGPEIDLSKKIVLVPSADPGFDWLFSRNIGGLITMYGGVNSHMAIRAAEFELPAAIGVGELLYEDLSQAQALELDCESRQITVVR
jgi:choline kinase/phosphohistidine swiveling domain-containing protein